MKIWHDDCRKPPDDSWVWVKNNTEAKDLIEKNLEDIVEMDLDHDLGADEVQGFDLLSYEDQILMAGGSEDDGLALVKWMCSTRHIPPNAKINIHSWNVVRSQRMEEELSDLGVKASRKPFTV